MSDLYPSIGHPEGVQGLPWYEIQNDEVYPSIGHPEGMQGIPWYE